MRDALKMKEVIPDDLRQHAMGWCLCAPGYPLWPEHNLDAVILFVPEDVVAIWRFLRRRCHLEPFWNPISGDDVISARP
jgi:hypothetical protein